MPRGPRSSGGNEPSSRSARVSGARRPTRLTRTSSSSRAGGRCLDRREAVACQLLGVHGRPSVPACPRPTTSLEPPTTRGVVSVTEDIAWYVELAIASGGPVLEIGVGSGRVAVPTALAGMRRRRRRQRAGHAGDGGRQGRGAGSGDRSAPGGHARPARPGHLSVGHGAVPRVPASQHRRRAPRGAAQPARRPGAGRHAGLRRVPPPPAGHRRDTRPVDGARARHPRAGAAGTRPTARSS